MKIIIFNTTLYVLYRYLNVKLILFLTDSNFLVIRFSLLSLFYIKKIIFSDIKSKTIFIENLSGKRNFQQLPRLNHLS